MRVSVTLNKTNLGKIQLACTRSTNKFGGIGMGYALPPYNPNAIAEVKGALQNLGIDERHDLREAGFAQGKLGRKTW